MVFKPGVAREETGIRVLEMRSVAIDPGTFTTGIVCLDDREVCGYREYKSYELSEKPHTLIDVIARMEPDVVVAPSGYGLPPIDLRYVEPKLLEEKGLLKPKKDPGIHELRFIRYFYSRIRDFSVPVIGMPGIRDLNTVPIYRKIYRLDLGTADKLGTVIYALSRVYDTDPELIYRINMIIVELGAFTSVIAVYRGLVVDGIGGTIFGVGLKSLGSLDLELAIYIRNMNKKMIFSGGIYDLAHSNDLEYIRSRRTIIYERYIDDIAKQVAMIMPSLEFKIDLIYISGRASKYDFLINDLKKHLKPYSKTVKKLETPNPKIKQSALGMAIYGNGYIGGRYRELITHTILCRIPT